MRPGSAPYRSSVLLKLTITMRLWMIGIFCLAAVQILAPAAGTNEIAGAAVETTTEVMDNHTMPAADGSATVAAVDSTRMAVAVVNNTVAPAVESTTAAAGNNTVAAAVETTTLAAGNDTAKVAVKNTGGAAGNKVDVATGKNTAKVAMNDTRVAAGKKIRVGASNNTRVAAGFKIGVDVAKETGKVAVSSATTAAVESTTADAGNYSETAPSNTAAVFGVPERSLRGIRSVGNEELNTGFAERIKNWFRRLINRMFGKKRNETTTPRPEDETAPVVELDKEDLLFIRRNPRRFNVNLTALTFDPKRDWGFRLGKWLIIRKVSPWKKTEGRLRGSHPRRSTTVEPTTPADDFPSETPATARSTGNYPPYRSNTASPTPSDPTDTASSMVTDAPRSTTFEEATPTPEAPAKGTTKVPDSTDKDTDEKKRDQSVEIIGPKE